MHCHLFCAYCIDPKQTQIHALLLCWYKYNEHKKHIPRVHWPEPHMLCVYGVLYIGLGRTTYAMCNVDIMYYT